MIDFKALARDFNIPIRTSGHHHCHEGWIQTHCPFCMRGHDGWHLGFSIETGALHCWRCGSVLLKDYLKARLPTESVVNIFKKYGGERPTSRRIVERSGPLEELEMPDGFGPLTPLHCRYLTDRGFDSGELVRIWELGGTRQRVDSNWRWRVVIPIRSREGLLVNFQGRALGEAAHRPRYVTYRPDVNKNLLYGEHKIHSLTDTVVVVEGPADVWRLGAGAVATLGVGWSETQAELISQYSHRYIYFDPDNAGRERAEVLATWLALYPGETEIIDADVEPGDLQPEEALAFMLSLGLGGALPCVNEVF